MKFFLMVLIMSISNQAFSKSLLTPCKDKPSCIISHKNLGKTRNYLEPIKYQSSKSSAYEKLIKILKSKKNVKIIQANPEYISTIYTSSIFKFIDDVEFTLEEVGLIHFKSNSRTGYFDFGANKDRIEKLRFEFHQSH